MTVRKVIVMRHGHAEPYCEDDFSRRLTARGLERARASAAALQDQGISVAWVLASPAARTRETAHTLLETWQLPRERLRKDSRLYLADVATLKTIITEQLTMDEAATTGVPGDLLIVGHNPGLSLLAQRELEPAEFSLVEPFAAL